MAWNPRLDSCAVILDAAMLFAEIGDRPKNENEIISKFAAHFIGKEDEARKDARNILAFLKAQKLIAVYDECRNVDESRKKKKESINIEEIECSDENSIVEDFCARHNILSELHIDLTNVCTERCVHCYVPQKRRDFLPYAMVEKALHEFRAMNGLTVHLTGGEAMLHRDFERICRLCVRLNLNFLVFSNLTLCDDRRISFLKEADPQFINVSLYSMKAAEHDAITCLPGSWQKTMDAILACEKAGVHIRLATPLLKSNRSAIPALKTFADMHRMHLIPNCDIVPRADHTCSNLSYACSATELHSVLSLNKQLFDRGWNGSMPNREDKICEIGTTRLYLNAKGYYYPCDCMHEYVLGSVRSNTLQEVWRGEKMNYLRMLKNKDFSTCLHCEHRPWCKVCPAFNFNATGDLFQTIPEKCALGAVVHEVYGGT